VTWALAIFFHISIANSVTRCQQRNFEFVTLVTCRSERFRGFWDEFVCCWTPSKNRYCSKQGFTRFLSTGVITASNHAFGRVVWNKVTVIWVLGHCWADTPHILTSEGDSLFFRSCSLSTDTVTPSDSDSLHRSASFKRFWSESTDSSRRVRFFAFIPRGVRAPRGACAKKWTFGSWSLLCQKFKGYAENFLKTYMGGWLVGFFSKTKLFLKEKYLYNGPFCGTNF